MRAVVSECRTYRYHLTRRWGPKPPLAVFVMLNPSTADADQDDPTIRKCIGFATRWGFDAMAVVNLFAVRSPKPSAISRHADPVGPENDEWIRRAMEQPCDRIIVAWGAHGDLFKRRVDDVLRIIGPRLMCSLSLTSTGQPGHPLMLPYSSVPAPWLPRLGIVKGGG